MNLDELWEQSTPITEDIDSIWEQSKPLMPTPEEYPLLKAAKDAYAGVEKVEAESSFGERGEAHKIVEDAVKQWWGDVSTPMARLWNEDHDAFTATGQVIKGTVGGVAGFFAGCLGKLYSELSQLPKVVLEKKGMDWEDVQKTGELWESFFHTEATDPMAQAVLTAISAIPSGIGMAFGVLADSMQTQAGKDLIDDIRNYLPDVPVIDLKTEDIQAAVGAALKAGGFLAELKAYQKEFGALGKKVKTRIPKPIKETAPKSWKKVGTGLKKEAIVHRETMTAKTRGIPGLKEAEAGVRRARVLKELKEERLKRGKEVIQRVRERQKIKEKEARKRQETYSMKKGVLEETWAEHYTSVTGKELTEIHPKYEGTGQIGREKLRPGRPQRSYFFKMGAKVPDRFKDKPRYRGKIEGKIYNLDKDPDGLGAKYSGTKLENKVIEHGYRGMSEGDVIEVFQPTKVGHVKDYEISIAPKEGTDLGQFQERLGKEYATEMTEVTEMMPAEGRWKGGSEPSPHATLRSAELERVIDTTRKIMEKESQYEAYVHEKLDIPYEKPSPAARKRLGLDPEQQPSLIVDLWDVTQGKKLSRAKLERIDSILDNAGIGGSKYLPDELHLRIHHITKYMNGKQFEAAVRAIVPKIDALFKGKGPRYSREWFKNYILENTKKIKAEKTKETLVKIREREIKTYERRKIAERERIKGIVKKEADTGESLAKAYPDHGLKYDGAWGEGEKPVYQFTPQKGKLAGKTFSVTELSKDAIDAVLKDVESRFDVPDLTPAQIAAIVRGEAPATTMDMLGLQKAYEAGVEMWRSAVADSPRTKAMVKKFRDEILEEIKGNPLDRAAIPFIKSQKFKDYLDNMPDMGDIKPGELIRLDPETGKMIATLVDAKGKPKAAVRQSGFHAITDFQQSLKGFKDIGKHSYEWTDMTRLLQEMDQGKFGGPVQQHILWPTHSTIEAKFLWQDQYKSKAAKVKDTFKINSKKKAQAVGDVIESITDRAMSFDEIAKIPNVANALRKIKKSDRPSIVSAAKRISEILEDIRNDINAARSKRNQKEIGEIPGYRPHVLESNIWNRWGFRDLKPSEVIDTPALPDFIRPNQPWFKQALKRKGLLEKYRLERDMFKLIGDYIDGAGKDIFHTNIIHNMKVHAAVMREAGLPHAAYAIERSAAEAFAGTSHWLTRGMRRVVPEPITRVATGIRRNLTRAVFPLNFSWNVFVQTSSAGLTLARYGAINNIKGLQYLSNRAINQAVKQNAYTHLTKTRWGGKMAYQDIARNIGKNKKLQASKIEKAEEFLNSFTSALESGLTGHAITAAYHHGKGLGLKGRALWEYASEGGGKTQSMYNMIDRPGILKAREVGTAAPFQTFAFEIMNTVRELNVVGLRRVVGKTGLYETMSARSAAGKALISKRLGILGRWTAAILVTNAVADAAIGRKPWRASSFLPFVAYILNGSAMSPDIAGREKQLPLPVEYVNDFYKGVNSYIQYGDWKKLRKWALRYHAPAGIQLERTIEGIEANANDGWIVDARGRKQFRVPEEERIKSIFTGPWKTTPGQERLKGKEGKKKKTLRTIVK